MSKMPTLKKQWRMRTKKKLQIPMSKTSQITRNQIQPVMKKLWRMMKKLWRMMKNLWRIMKKWQKSKLQTMIKSQWTMRKKHQIPILKTNQTKIQEMKNKFKNQTKLSKRKILKLKSLFLLICYLKFKALLV